MSAQLPSIPASHDNFISYLDQNPNTPLRELVWPYKEYESRLREVFAQHRNDPVLDNAAVNAVPIFAGHENTLKTRARDPANDAHDDKYIMPLKAEDRRADGSPAMAESLKEFRNNFNLFSEQSLTEMNWDNVIVAGSSVVTAMLPVPEQHRTSKRALREYYHQKLAPSSDVDLFLVGLDEAGATKKISQIEECIRNSVLAETTTIRTKNAITIASQYPTRHIQIVLRLYKSISEVLTGFDIDSSCFAYDGKQVWATPRGVTAYCSQVNEVDLTRRSPSYETRLAKYAHRGFEVYFPDLDRTRIDPTLFERSFVRTLGLARLLLLEKLPTETDRDNYLNQRRIERGRPQLDMYVRRMNRGQLPGNKKDDDPEDVPDWEFDDAVANYHTFTVPYGPKYHAKKIERLLFTKDMLLNAEWNKNDDRKVNLHRHPCFLGDVASIIHDCCGACPQPTNDEERRVAEEEGKTYVSGEITFLVDDPGRQQIGSFNPLTELDWTDMAYLGNTQILCEAIIDNDIDAIRSWLEQEENDVNHRDHSGRMPLHLAIMCGHREIVQVLIEAGARITSRIQDGFTALHMAAAVGRADIIKIIGEKSEANEVMESEKDDLKKATNKSNQDADVEMVDVEDVAKDEDDDEDEHSDEDSEDYENSGDESDDDDVTQGSFVKVKKEEDKEVALDDPFGPDFFDMNVLSWDSPLSPVHVAILAGHPDCVETLCSLFGADPLLPVAFRPGPYGANNNALLPLVLACKTASPDSLSVIRKLIDLGAKPSQSDTSMVSALHGSILLNNVEAMQAMMQLDRPSAQTALNFVTTNAQPFHYNFQVSTPLNSAISSRNAELAHSVLELGAQPHIPYEEFCKAYLRSVGDKGFGNKPDEEELQKKFQTITQPVLLAATANLPSVVKTLIETGAEINTINGNGGRKLTNQHFYGEEPATVLDTVNAKIKELEDSHKGNSMSYFPNTDRKLIVNDDPRQKRLEQGGYEHTVAAESFYLARTVRDKIARLQQNAKAKRTTDAAAKERESENAENEALLTDYKELREWLLEREAKSFNELHPEHKREEDGTRNQRFAYSGQKTYVDDEAAYAFEHSFQDPGASKSKQAAYMKLFNAAWDGDLESVKALTLKPFEDDQGAPLSPLPITTKDSVSQTVLGIAIGRNHQHMVRTIIDIAQAQYKAPDGMGRRQKRRYRIRQEQDDEDYDSEDSSEMDPEAIPITSEVVSNEFTIDDLGKLTETVGSEVAVDDFITGTNSMLAFCKPGRGLPHWTSSDHIRVDQHEPIDKVGAKSVRDLWQNAIGLLSYAVEKNDLELLRFLLKAAKDGSLARKDLATPRDWSKDYSLLHCLQCAIREGKTAIAEELISTTGVHMPLEQLMAQITIPEDAQEKSKYYQGLKMYGKHKKDWAQQASGERMTQDTKAVKWSPFLNEMKLGEANLRAVEFWLSDAALRMYRNFGEAHQDDKRVALLARDAGSWETVATKWLGLRRHLALHVSVLSCNRPEDVKILQYLLRVLPEDLDKKSRSGYTPLWLAFNARDAEVASMLIERGADQTARDRAGSNILHSLLSKEFWVHLRSDVPEKSDPSPIYAQIEALLKLVDRRLLADLFTERSSVGVSGLTPFALWARQSNPDERLYDILEKYMPEDVYTMYDGSGQTPIHSLIMQEKPALLKRFITKRPYLLGLENGSGQTAFELAQARFIQTQGSQSLPQPGNAVQRGGFRSRRRRGLGDEASAPEKPQETAYTVLRDLVRGNPQVKRKVISVNDAREVARRLAEKQKTQASDSPVYYRSYRHRYSQQNDEGDEVDELFGSINDQWRVIERMKKAKAT